MNFLLPSVAIDPIHQFQVSKWLDLNIGCILYVWFAVSTV